MPKLRLLGVILSQDLVWSSHARRSRAAVNSDSADNGMISTINRFDSSLSVETRKCIVNALIEPKLMYKLPVWCWVTKTDEKAFDHTILRCARVILRKRDAKLDIIIYSLTGLLQIAQLPSLQCLMRIHQFLNMEYPVNYPPSFLFAVGKDRTARNITGRKFFIREYKRATDTECFSYMAAKL